MAALSDETIINKLATEFESIGGLKSYPFAKNPDNLTNAQLPCVIFYPVQIDSEQVAHHNVWKNTIQIRAILFVTPRAQSASLKFIDNAAMPWLFKVRKHFQTESVVSGILALGLTKFLLNRSVYGAGGPTLTYNGQGFVGSIHDFTLVESR
jgi:hypothetical protein